MKKSILTLIIAALFSVVSGVALSYNFNVNAGVAGGLIFIGIAALSLGKSTKSSKLAYSLTYSPILFTGSFYEEIFNEILYMNRTIESGLVRLIDNVNTETVITESNVTRSTQAYVPSPTNSNASGSLAYADKILRPYQFMIYDEFTPNTVILSRLGKPNSGSTTFPKVTDEYTRAILARYGAAEAQLMESRFWNAATSATKTAVAALTPGTGQNAVGAAEQTYVAAAPTDFIDGILTKFILTFSVTKRRIKVAGTTVTASNIATEYAKVYAAVLPQLLQPNNPNPVVMFVPHNHLQLINTFNISATYRDLFQVSGGKYFYSGIPIEFVPLPNNAIICGIANDIIWGCDVTSADAMVKMDFLSANSEDMFIKAPYTQESAFAQAQQFVVYVG
jgi:hypothetical protein